MRGRVGIAPGAAAPGLALLLTLGAGRSAATPLSDPGCGTSALALHPGTLVYALPHSFIRTGSDSAWTRLGPWRAGTDYVLDPLRGELRLLRDPGAGDTLWVRACWLMTPPPLEIQLNRYRPVSHGPDSVAAPAAPPAVRPGAARALGRAPSGAALTLTGNKTIAVDFGSLQDAFLRQSLDLALSGTLAPGVQLTGVISDRNTPLTGAGTTQDLQALDRVLIQLDAPRGSAALGDLTLRLDQGEFARLERRLQGVRGEWSLGGFRSLVSAASAQGEFHRMQFLGVEGRQGPYLLTDRDGGLGVSVVAGSEVVTLDGERLTRGEGADYSMDYERARLTFSNRRLITSTSRITVDYQFTVNRYRRNLGVAGTQWSHGALSGFVRMLTESDDRGRPLDLTLDAADRLVLAAAGDSASRSIGPGVQNGGGDYDTVRVSAVTLAFQYVGGDSGAFAVQFARVGAGRGEYADSTLASGGSAYRYVGAGNGGFAIGRALPLPESHQLWALGGGGRYGAAAVEFEGALSRHDRNAFSSLDDRDNSGLAGRAALKLQGRVPGPLGGSGALQLSGRAVAERFAPFARLERPFAQEDWGLAVDADLEHQQRLELSGEWKPRPGGELHASVGRLTTPAGYSALRRAAEWTREGRVATRALWERAEARRGGLAFGDGGRDHWRAEVHARPGLVEPGLRAEFDARRAPSDSGRVGTRFRELGFDLQNARGFRWRALAGVALRRDARATRTGFQDQSEARTLRLALESPAEGTLGASLLLQRRDVRPLADPKRSRSDLGSVRLRADDARHGLKGQMNLEVTAEGENLRLRALTFVGAGFGHYDALGNFVGTGDYELSVAVGAGLERLARAATSTRSSWEFGASDDWRGSRIEWTFESEARRRGDLRWTDVLVSPGAALADPALARGSVLQRLETELAPGSRAAAVRMRLERRVSADRSYQNFAQTLDDRQGSLRWRARPGVAVSTELEARLRRQIAEQRLTGAAGYRRVLIDQGGSGQIIVTPDARLRLVGAVEATWSRPEGQAEFTRTLRIGPDAGLALGARGRSELSVRRAFVSGPPASALLPSADPAGAPRWDGTSRFDYRVRESTTVGISLTVRDRPRQGTQYTGRAELRAFF